MSEVIRGRERIREQESPRDGMALLLTEEIAFTDAWAGEAV